MLISHLLGLSSISLLEQYSTHLPREWCQYDESYQLTIKAISNKPTGQPKEDKSPSVSSQVSPPCVKLIIKINQKKEGGREGKQEKSTDCSSIRPAFNSLHPHSSSQTPLTPVPGDWTPSSSFLGHQASKQYIDIRAGQTLIHKSNFSKFKQKSSVVAGTSDLALGRQRKAPLSSRPAEAT